MWALFPELRAVCWKYLLAKMNINIYNKEGKKTGTYDAPDNLFDLPFNNDLVYQVFNAKLSSARKNYAHTKTRGEVRGGGIKPWKQKGTGKARHGSIRSPIWVGGGTTFGPRKDRSYESKVNKKMNAKAIFTVFSNKARNKNIFVVESLSYDSPKTKQGYALLKNLKLDLKSILVFGVKKDDNFKFVFRNIPRVTPVFIEGLNIVDILQRENIVFSKTAIDELVKQYVTKIKNQNVKIKNINEKSNLKTNKLLVSPTK